MKHYYLLLLMIIVTTSCSDNENELDNSNTNISYTGVYSGTVQRTGGLSPYGFEATVSDNVILKFRCSSPSINTCFVEQTNGVIGSNGGFEIGDGEFDFKGAITSDFKMSGTFTYTFDGIVRVSNFSGVRN